MKQSSTNQFLSFFRGFKEGMHLFSSRISLLVNTILLFFVYIIGVGFSSVIARITGKQFLTLRLDKKAATYWEDLDLKKKPMKEYYRQF